jgi:hypothetical protein
MMHDGAIHETAMANGSISPKRGKASWYCVDESKNLFR